MLADPSIVRGLTLLLLVAQFGLCALSVSALLQAWIRRRPRWTHLQFEDDGPQPAPKWLLRAAGIRRGSQSFLTRETLLAGCGFAYDPAWYMFARRVAILFGSAALICGAAFPTYMPLPPDRILWLQAAGAALAACALCDKPLLESVRKARSELIMREILAVSNQLLYFAGAALHLHVKLTRCLPYTSVIRSDLRRMLAEWYHDAGEAIARFKRRVGTAEAASFAETIEALRLREDDAFYALLRERIADYKAKIELSREGRKEAASYVLFVLAGVPILYMFQIFIYPWVQESQQLFQSLQ
ncbi:MAG: hypothetical protein C6W55_16940 [Thermobacillus sp.]|uniref:hypothetical protein n=1 Tax=Thermobacillus sp. TaxID=2108467 RepID=UPI000E36E45F|nr:hypothetical protein [Thermobacillus sp.]REK52263.1 MAG: hypothetical protein C6W55_16940 [Thermobacillus sp.]